MLGYIDPAYFLGGRLALYADQARAAIERNVAAPVGLSVEHAAHSVLAVANEHMVTAIRDITINEGIDPRDSLLVAGGGASGMTIGRIAEELGCTRVLVPRTAGVLSACGGLFSDIVTEFSISHRSDTNRFDFHAVNEALAGLGRQMQAFFDRLETPSQLRRMEFFVEARYPYQVWELEVPLTRGRFDSGDDVQVMVQAFHVVHDRVFAVSEPGQHIECIYWKGRATASLPKPGLHQSARETGIREPPTSAPAWFGGDRPIQTRRHFGYQLHAGQEIQGPAILEEPTTTVVVYPGWSATITAGGDYFMKKRNIG